MTKQTVLDAIQACTLASPSAYQALKGDSDSPIIASKGAGSIHALRRRSGRGWRYLGYAVWSCRQQGWVKGSWTHPLQDAACAEQALRHLPWEG